MKPLISFRKTRVIPPLHTGGPIALTPDGSKIVTCVEEDILITEVESGLGICKLQSDSATVTSMCVSPSGKHLNIFTSSLSLRIYDLSSLSNQDLLPIRHVPRAHDAPVHVAVVDQSSSYLASGGADGVVKVWDISQGYVTHVLRGHGGLISSLVFHRSESLIKRNAISLITGSTDNYIRIFNLSSSSGANIRPDMILEGHSSVPRGIAVSSDGRWVISGGRDSVILLWDLTSVKHGRHPVGPSQTIPTLERIEGLDIIPFENSKHQHQRNGSDKLPSLTVFTVGEQGRVRIWDISQGTVLSTLEGTSVSDDHVQNEIQGILSAHYLSARNLIVCLFADQNILFYSLDSRSVIRRLIGFNDEVTDAAFVRPSLLSLSDSFLAITTNSSLVRIYSMDTFDAYILAGHNDIVMCIDRSVDGTIFATGSKDSTARLWACNASSLELPNKIDWRCIVICEGHTGSIGSVALSRSSDENRLRFMCTASQDRTIKVWDLSSISTDSSFEPARARSVATLRAHEKDINALDVSCDDLMLVSGSQDKTAKVYSIIHRPGYGELRLLGVCKGHKRGVWSVQFSSTKHLLATGSGDKTIKLWNLRDFSCLKTFEGHTNSILRLRFNKVGGRLSSAAADGLVKVWDVESEHCMITLDNHQDKVWALVTNENENLLVSGGADSVVTFWQDSSEEEERDREKQRHDAIICEQNLENYIRLEDYQNAILLALTIDRPNRLLSLLQSTYTQSKTTSSLKLETIFESLSASSLAKLLSLVQVWNATSGNAEIAQVVLHSIAKYQPADAVLNALKIPVEKNQNTSSPKGFFDSTISYTERHLRRLRKLEQDSWVLDLILDEMSSGI